MNDELKHLAVEWLHDFEDEAIYWYHEIDKDGWEIRKVVVYRDGKMQFADKNHENDDIFLSPVVIPPIEEIAEDPEFRPCYISQEEFERVWYQATGQVSFE